MNIDILFVDAACQKEYDWTTIENESLGGTESSTIRLAEGFASKGHSVAVLQKFDFVGKISPKGVYYVPFTWLDKIKPKNIIFIRAKGNFERFKDSKQFVWFHDASQPGHNDHYNLYITDMIKYSVIGVAVSDWHITNIHRYAPNLPLIRIYSPVDETCYRYPTNGHDKNQVVWMSSPHKGLKEALVTFQKLRAIEPSFKMGVFNPGYYSEDMGLHENVAFVPGASKQIVRSVVSQSLCLFYPTQFEETFGLVAAEANALGTPVACYKVAALAESSVDTFSESEDKLIDQVLSWRNGNRPKITGQDRFRFEAIYPEWLKVLDVN